MFIQVFLPLSHDKQLVKVAEKKWKTDFFIFHSFICVQQQRPFPSSIIAYLLFINLFLQVRQQSVKTFLLDLTISA